MRKILLSIFTISIVLLVGCKKDPGIGGNGSITGKVITRKFNSTFTKLLGVYPTPDHYVYIVYGDHVGYDNRVKTDYNGTYKFVYLYPGKYTIYTYSKDSTGQLLSGLVPISQTVEIKRNQQFNMSDLVIYE